MYEIFCVCIKEIEIKSKYCFYSLTYIRESVVSSEVEVRANGG